MALAFSLLTADKDTTNNPATTASINPTAGSVTYAFIGYAVEGGGTTTDPDSVALSGGRGTWATIGQRSDADAPGTIGRRGLFLVRGTGTVANETVGITISAGSGTWTETVWAFIEVTGQDGTTPDDTAVEASGGSGTSGELGDLGTPDAGDVVLAGWCHENDEAVSATGLTQLAAVTGCSDLRTLHVFYDASDPQDETPAASWASSSSWGAIGLIVNVGAGGASSTQEGYRWRMDDGDEANATWAANQDTGITAPANTTRRLRVLVDTSGDVNAAQFQLEYKEANEANWTKIT